MHVARTGQERNACKFCSKRERQTLFGDKSRNGGLILKRSWGHRLHGCGFIWLRIQRRAPLHTVMNLSDSHKAQNVLATVTKSKLFQDLYSSPYVFISLSVSTALRYRLGSGANKRRSRSVISRLLLAGVGRQTGSFHTSGHSVRSATVWWLDDWLQIMTRRMGNGDRAEGGLRLEQQK